MDFQTHFTYRDAIPHQEGVTRRDPSPVILVGNTYHVWYTRATVDHSGYYGSIYHATSPDGLEWHERKEAVPKGGPNAWDENGVFTPTILIADSQYFIFYTAVPKPFHQDPVDPTPTAIGIAMADSPGGPWRKFEGNPVLEPGPEGTFDCLRVDDSCMIKRDDKYWMYYKGRGRKDTPMGLAIADDPTGPYFKHSYSPLVESGHEVCVWPHGDGVAALVGHTGPNPHNIRYAPDGLHFSVEFQTKVPAAPGPYRKDRFRDGPGPGITWGLCIGRHPEHPFLQRFDCDLRAKP
ncbi:MAG: xylosidase [Planctomycetes bacterium]|nr:xylosidase [Planctomycetota bacterium]